MKKILFLLIAVMMVFALTACGDKKSDADDSAQTKKVLEGEGDSRGEEEEKIPTIKIAMVTDTGTIDDKSFNQGTWEGIQEYAEQSGSDARYIKPEGETETDYLNAIDSLVTAGYEIIVTPGFKFEVAIYQAQTRYPDTHFVLIDGVPHTEDYSDDTQEDNVVSVLFNEHESGFLAGIAAALESKTGKVSFIGGMAVPAVARFGFGYVAGVAYANANYGTDCTVADYEYQGTFNDAAAGQTLAAGMYDKGSDIIFAAAGSVGIGVINEAKTRGNVWVIGVDKDQYLEGETEDGTSIILTSAMKGIHAAAFQYCKAFAEDSFPGGQVVTMGAKNNGISLPDENPNLSPGTKDKADAAFADIANDTIAVPDTNEGLLAYLDELDYKTPEGVKYATD